LTRRRSGLPLPSSLFTPILPMRWKCGRASLGHMAWELRMSKVFTVALYAAVIVAGFGINDFLAQAMELLPGVGPQRFILPPWLDVALLGFGLCGAFMARSALDASARAAAAAAAPNTD
jgi:hypothetical protein